MVAADTKAAALSSAIGLRLVWVGGTDGSAMKCHQLRMFGRNHNRSLAP
jgi:hypothetical protein